MGKVKGAALSIHYVCLDSFCSMGRNKFYNPSISHSNFKVNVLSSKYALQNMLKFKWGSSKYNEIYGRLKKLCLLGDFF